MALTVRSFNKTPDGDVQPQTDASSRMLRWARPSLAEGELERDLVARSQGGDRRAFDRLASSYRPRLHAFLARKVSSEEVDDLVQACLIAAWNGLPAFAGRSTFKAWLFALSEFKLKDHYRDRERRNEARLDDSSELTGAEEPAFRELEVSDAVQVLLKNLTPDQSEILRLYYLGSLNLAEVAKKLDKNLNTVKYHFYQAHQHIASQIDAGGTVR